jgi:hypothetical protein
MKTTMLPDHKTICEKHLLLWHQLKYTSTMNKLTADVTRDLLVVFENHLKSKEAICKWCPDSQAYLVRQVFQAYERDAVNPITTSLLKTTIERPNENKVSVILTDVPEQSVTQSVPEQSAPLVVADLPPATQEEPEQQEPEQQITSKQNTLFLGEKVTGNKLKKHKNNRK